MPGSDRDRLCVEQEIKGAPMNSWPAFVGLYRQRQPSRGIRPPNCPPRIRTHGIQFHLSCEMVVGAAGFEPATS